jgi:hypothetical protein
VRSIRGDGALEEVFGLPLMLARGARAAPEPAGLKVYSLHAPEVECIGKGPYEFGLKVSIAITLHLSKGGQFTAHAQALPGNPYDGHTLAAVIPEIEAQVGASLTRIVADRGYRSHNAPPDIASRSLSQPGSDALPNTSSANCVAARLSSRSSTTPKASVAWAAITSQASKAMRPTPSLPPRDTTSEDCWLGSSFGCRHSCAR